MREDRVALRSDPSANMGLEGRRCRLAASLFYASLETKALNLRGVGRSPTVRFQIVLEKLGSRCFKTVERKILNALFLAQPIARKPEKLNQIGAGINVILFNPSCRHTACRLRYNCTEITQAFPCGDIIGIHAV